jgi:hypothetical protein
LGYPRTSATADLIRVRLLFSALFAEGNEKFLQQLRRIRLDLAPHEIHYPGAIPFIPDPQEHLRTGLADTVSRLDRFAVFNAAARRVNRYGLPYLVNTEVKSGLLLEYPRPVTFVESGNYRLYHDLSPQICKNMGGACAPPKSITHQSGY